MMKKKDENISNIIKQRLEEFEENYKKDNLCWFKELCFCLLTANFKAQESIDICEEERECAAFIIYSEKILSKFFYKDILKFPIN